METQDVLVGLHLPSILDLLGVLQELKQVAEEGDGLSFLTTTTTLSENNVYSHYSLSLKTNLICAFADEDLPSQITFPSHLTGSSVTALPHQNTPEHEYLKLIKVTGVSSS